MATFKYIVSTYETDFTKADVITNGEESKGTSYYNSSADAQYVYVENAPLVKFLAKTTSGPSPTIDPTSYVVLDIDDNFALQKTNVDILKYVEGGEEDINGNQTMGHIECNYHNVTKDTFPYALVSEVSKDGVGRSFLIAIPSTRNDASQNWERKKFHKLFSINTDTSFKPNINYSEPSKINDGNVVITFNDRVSVAIDDVTNDNGDITVDGNTILCDGRFLSVVCTDALYNEILLNGIKSIKLETFYTSNIEPTKLESGEGFVGEGLVGE